jgi:hypothetical protein
MTVGVAIMAAETSAVWHGIKTAVSPRSCRLEARNHAACCRLTRGLPQSHAYDIVYRHALALDGAGDRLAFGSTTGGLWVSEDLGDSWACVSHTLPPIYAVRFA